MCFRLLGGCLCCCCQLGFKILCSLIFSIVGVLIILALVVYFCVFYNKSKETTPDVDDPVMTTALDMLGEINTVVPKDDPTDNRGGVRGYLYRMMDRL